MDPKNEELQQQIAALEQNLRSRLTRDALARYGNIRAANPEQAVKVLVAMTQLLTKTDKMITDSEFKDILREIIPKKRSINIKRV